MPSHYLVSAHHSVQCGVSVLHLEISSRGARLSLPEKRGTSLSGSNDISLDREGRGEYSNGVNVPAVPPKCTPARGHLGLVWLVRPY